jgi:hypothetical protein
LRFSIRGSIGGEGKYYSHSEKLLSLILIIHGKLLMDKVSFNPIKIKLKNADIDNYEKARKKKMNTESGICFYRFYSWGKSGKEYAKVMKMMLLK